MVPLNPMISDAQYLAQRRMRQQQLLDAKTLVFGGKSLYLVKLLSEVNGHGRSTARFQPNSSSVVTSALATRDLEKVLDAAMGKKADYAGSVFRNNSGAYEGIQSGRGGWSKNCSQSTSNGVGVRVLAESKNGSYN